MKSIFWMPVVSIWFCRLNLVWLCLSFFSSCGRSGLGPARYGVRIWRGQAIFPQRDSTWPKLWWGNELLVTCLVNYNNGHVLISLRKSVTRCLWNSCSPSSTSWMGRSHGSGWGWLGPAVGFTSSCSINYAIMHRSVGESHWVRHKTSKKLGWWCSRSAAIRLVCCLVWFPGSPDDSGWSLRSMNVHCSAETVSESAVWCGSLVNDVSCVWVFPLFKAVVLAFLTLHIPSVLFPGSCKTSSFPMEKQVNQFFRTQQANLSLQVQIVFVCFEHWAFGMGLASWCDANLKSMMIVVSMYHNLWPTCSKTKQKHFLAQCKHTMLKWRWTWKCWKAEVES